MKQVQNFTLHNLVCTYGGVGNGKQIHLFY